MKKNLKQSHLTKQMGMGMGIGISLILSFQVAMAAPVNTTQILYGPTPQSGAPIPQTLTVPYTTDITCGKSGIVVGPHMTTHNIQFTPPAVVAGTTPLINSCYTMAPAVAASAGVPAKPTVPILWADEGGIFSIPDPQTASGGVPTNNVCDQTDIYFGYGNPGSDSKVNLCEGRTFVCANIGRSQNSTYGTSSDSNEGDFGWTHPGYNSHSFSDGAGVKINHGWAETLHFLNTGPFNDPFSTSGPLTTLACYYMIPGPAGVSVPSLITVRGQAGKTPIPPTIPADSNSNHDSSCYCKGAHTTVGAANDHHIVNGNGNGMDYNVRGGPISQ